MVCFFHSSAFKSIAISCHTYVFLKSAEKQDRALAGRDTLIMGPKSIQEGEADNYEAQQD